MQSIPRSLFVLLVLLGPSSLIGVGRHSPISYSEAGAAATWRDAPDYVTLFAPVNARAAYSAATSPDSLDAVLAEIRDEAASVLAPGSWQPRTESATDTFGTAGLHNRWTLARLFGSRQVRVARGARMDRGRIVESWTLMSPYPSTDLRTLHAGTLRVALRIAP